MDIFNLLSKKVNSSGDKTITIKGSYVETENISHKISTMWNTVSVPLFKIIVSLTIVSVTINRFPIQISLYDSIGRRDVGRTEKDDKKIWRPRDLQM